MNGTSTKAAGLIVGLPESHLEHALLENVQIEAEGAGLEIRNVNDVELKNVKIIPKTGEPIIVKDSEVRGL
jgi:hypothetical protein